MTRPFRGLRDRPPASAYDAIVVGSGIGGLICANLLVRRGLRVLLVEQHYMAGGYCSTFRRRGYTFDAATHFYPLLGNPATITGRLLVDLGVETRWVKMDPVDTFHLPDGSRFRVPADFATYLGQLKLAFPEQAHALDTFFAEVRGAYLHGLLHHFRTPSRAPLGNLAGLTVRDVLDRHFDDRKLKLILTADCPHWGSPPKRTSFVFDSMLRLSYFLGNYYPVGGSQAFSDELARCFEVQGGDILMSTRVDRIEVEAGRVRGIQAETMRGRLKGFHRVDAPVVVSNADALETYARLLPAAVVDPGQLTALRRLRPSYPCYLTHVGLAGMAPDVLDAAQGYYWNTWDADDLGRGALRFKIFCPTHYEPGLAPSEGQIVILQKVLEIDYDGISDWTAHKLEIERYLVAGLESAVPGISEHIVTVSTASAFTSWRFTRNRVGAMLGWEMSPDQLGDERPDVVTSVPGLYLAGHWTRPGGGITPVIVSAMRVAEAVTGSRSTWSTPTRTPSEWLSAPHAAVSELAVS